MMKARSGADLLFGLSARNLELLMQGKPIAVDLRDLGMAEGRVVIFYGRTEDEMKQSLIDAGVQFPPAQKN